MAKKKKEQMLDAAPKFNMEFDATLKNDMEAVVILSAYYHSHGDFNRAQKLLDAADAFEKYIKAKEAIENT